MDLLFHPTTLHYLAGLVLILLAAQALLTLYRAFNRVVAEREAAASAKAILEKRLARYHLESAGKTPGSQGWNGYRKFEVAKRVREADDVCSYYLVPHDKKAIPAFKPGQFLTFHVRIPNHSKPLTRCYSLSDAPAGNGPYRITVKRIPAMAPNGKPGVVSNYFFDHLGEGDIIDVAAPAGSFTLDPGADRPVVLIAGGIGVTPLLSMLEAILKGPNPGREVWFFYGVTCKRQHAFRTRLKELAETHKNLHYICCYSHKEEGDRQGEDYHFDQMITLNLLQQSLPSNNFPFYICGPSPMMSAVTEALEQWGVPAQDIHTEAFGPASVKQLHPTESAQTYEVAFAKSGKTVTWSSESGTLLDLAEQAGIAIDSGCRAGNCGSCLVAVHEGRVHYLHTPAAPVEEGSCLTCLALPKSKLVLDI